MKNEKPEVKPNNFFAKSFKWKLRLSDNNKKEINTKISFSSGAFRKYFANTSWTFAEKILRLIITFLVGIYIVRYLGPAKYGLLSYAISFVALFSSIASLGLDNIIVREMVKNPEKSNSLLGSAFILRLIGAAASTLLILIVILAMKEDVLTITLILVISFTSFFQTFNIIGSYFQAKVLLKYSSIAQFSSLVIGSIIKILLIITDSDLLSFAIAISLESLFLAFGYYTFYAVKKMRIIDWKFVKEIAIGFIKDSWPLILAGIAIAVYMKIDQIMIKNMLNETEVGFYSAAVRVCEAWYFIPIAIVSSLFPAIVNAKRVGVELFNSRLQKLYDMLTFLAIMIAIPITFFSEEIILILLGDNFLPSAPVMIIYIWAGVAVFLGVASDQYLVVENYTKISFARSVFGMVLNIGLNLILIPKYQIMGSALATLISYTVATFSIVLIKGSSVQGRMMLKSLYFKNVVVFFINKLKKN